MIQQKQITISKSGYQKLFSDKEELTKKRAEVLVRLVRAREMGDLSENFAYKAARMEISDIDRRIRQINLHIRLAKVIDYQYTGIIAIGSKVTIDNGIKETEYEIKGDFEADPSKKIISVNSPLGQVLMGKKVGDKVELVLAEGKKELEIKKVK